MKCSNSISLALALAILSSCGRPSEQPRLVQDKSTRPPAAATYEPAPIRRVEQFYRSQTEQPKKPSWIYQTFDYVRNEMPLEFLQRVMSQQDFNGPPQTEIYINLRNGSKSKHLLILKSLSESEYGFSIFTVDNFSDPIAYGRFANESDGSFFWIDGSGADSESFGTFGGEPFRNVTKIPGLDFDIIALDDGAKQFVDQGSSINLRGYSHVIPQPDIFGGAGPMPSGDFCKFYVTNGGAPKGQVRFLYWGDFKLTDFGNPESED
jgi:hypothetical protein